MFINIEDYLTKKIANRLKHERTKLGFSQLRISDIPSQISNVENQVTDVTSTVLKKYATELLLSEEYLFWGDDSEIEELVEWIFFQYFSLVVIHPLETDFETYKNTFYESLLVDGNDDIKLQKAMLKIAGYLGEYNLKRAVFDTSPDYFMDYNFNFISVTERVTLHLIDFDVLWGEYGRLKDDSGKVFDESRVMGFFINYFYMFNVIWSFLKKDIVHHFKVNFLNSFDYYKFKMTNLNNNIKFWQRSLIYDIDDIISNCLDNNKIMQNGIAVRSILKSIDSPIIEVAQDLKKRLNLKGADVLQGMEIVLFNAISQYFYTNFNTEEMFNNIYQSLYADLMKLEELVIEDYQRFQDVMKLLDVLMKILEQNYSVKYNL